MGRPERPLDPSTGPVAAFADQLRQLRAAAGNPSYRSMANHSHYSVSTLARAAAGQLLPSEEVALAYVRACGGDPKEWVPRWSEADRLARNLRPAGATPPLSAPEDVAAAPVDDRQPPPRLPHGWRSPRMSAALRSRKGRAAASAFLVACAGMATLSLFHRTDARPSRVGAQPQAAVSGAARGVTAAPRPAWPDQPAEDGSDPKQALCQSDATTLDAKELALPGRTVIGSVELRYSPHCRAAWARFVGTPALDHMQHIVVSVEADRPSDHRSLPFSMDYPYDTVWSDILLTSRGCVLARATVTVGTTRSIAGETYCLTNRSRASN